MLDTLEYKIRLVTLPSQRIYNMVGPYDFRDEQTRRSHGGVQIAERKQFYTDLEHSVTVEGFRNPIVVVAGKIFETEWPTVPSFVHDDPLVCPQYGGSRLWVAQKLGIQIPCLVCDYTGMFDSSEESLSVSQIRQLIGDEVRINVKPHYVEIFKESDHA